MTTIPRPNRLIHETSPYLLQHAHNPVDWYPWGPEALARAQAEDKPILLSVGYSACHWCHVMAHESFEDPETAALMNELFVNVKVDREERPDIDAIYMEAVQALTGRGGWPMTVFLTPDGRPFYGGTYFPPRDGARGTGFLSVLRKLDAVYRDQPARVAEAAASLAATVRTNLSGTTATDLPSAQALDAAAAFYRGHYDAQYGGLRRAPKFPSSLPIRFLLTQLPLPSAEIPYTPGPRFAGKPKYTLGRMLRFAFESLFSFSLVPLYFGYVLGFVFLVLFFLYGLYVFYVRLVLGRALEGWSSIMLVVLVASAVQFLLIGILGGYIGAIHREVKRRPRYVIGETLGLDSRESAEAGHPEPTGEEAAVPRRPPGT